MKELCSVAASVTVYQCTWHNIAEDLDFHFHQSGNIGFHFNFSVPPPICSFSLHISQNFSGKVECAFFVSPVQTTILCLQSRLHFLCPQSRLHFLCHQPRLHFLCPQSRLYFCVSSPDYIFCVPSPDYIFCLQSRIHFLCLQSRLHFLCPQSRLHFLCLQSRLHFKPVKN